MAKIPLPDRGQPLDVTYMYQIATAINDLSDSISNATGKYATINTNSVGKKTLKIPDMRVYADYIEVSNAATVTSKTIIEKRIDFGVSFAYAPIVTATIVNNSNQVSGNDADVVITSTTTSAVNLRVKFATAGEASVGINIIAVGVPA